MRAPLSAVATPRRLQAHRRRLHCARRGRGATSTALVSAVVKAILACLLAVPVVSMCGCKSLPQQPERQESHAILDTAHTRLGNSVEPYLAQHPGMSGFHPLDQGADAFVARVALVRAAERTLDVQYYAFHADGIGAALMNELLMAADRGVRVRLLLDDLHTSGQDDILAALDSHANVEVRLFNPFVHRGARWLDFLGDFSRVNRRMHNKSITADSLVSVVGGRNIGDEYFAAPTELEFSDFDVIAFGPVAADVSAEFDEYWNSDVVYPLASLHVGSDAAKASLPEVRLRLEKHLATLRNTPYARGLQATDLARALEQKDLAVFWGQARLIADQPGKVTLPADDASTHAMPKLRAVLEQSQRELILVSPYFVPGKAGMAWLQAMAGRGVHIIILTNSFAATDVSTVHSAYSPYRKNLLHLGIELYELKPSNVKKLDPASKEHSGKKSKSSLHAKTYMSDSRMLYVGSMNLDPRSASLNTEMGFVIDSETLSSRVRTQFLARLPENAYQVELDTSVDKGGRLVWVTQADGREVRTEAEPDMGSFDKFMMSLQRMLPIENQL
jgi:cardiolipin synthase C